MNPPILIGIFQFTLRDLMLRVALAPAGTLRPCPDGPGYR
jgi:hypothetical protein